MQYGTKQSSQKIETQMVEKHVFNIFNHQRNSN